MYDEAILKFSSGVLRALGKFPWQRYQPNKRALRFDRFCFKSFSLRSRMRSLLAAATKFGGLHLPEHRLNQDARCQVARVYPVRR